MMIALLVAGIGFLLAGLLGIAYGIPIKEFSFGNTVILAGAMSACTGMIMIALCLVVRELKGMAEHFQTSAALGPGSAFPVAPMTDAAADDLQPGEDGLLFDQPGAASPAGDPAAPPARPPPWHEETATRDRARSEAPPAEAPAAPKRRNLLFSSTSRKERERAEARATDPALTNAPPAVAPPP